MSLAEKIQYNLKRKLSERKVSISEFEKEAGLKKSAVSNILIGRSKNPTVEVLSSIAKELSCSIEDLISSNSPQPKHVYRDFFQEKTLTEQQLKTLAKASKIVAVESETRALELTIDTYMALVMEISFIAITSDENKIEDKRFIDWIFDRKI